MTQKIVCNNIISHLLLHKFMKANTDNHNFRKRNLLVEFKEKNLNF